MCGNMNPQQPLRLLGAFLQLDGFAAGKVVQLFSHSFLEEGVLLVSRAVAGVIDGVLRKKALRRI